jgi:hypothetical protein
VKGLELSESSGVFGLEPLDLLYMRLAEFALFVRGLPLSLLENRSVRCLQLVDGMVVAAFDLLEDEDLLFGGFLPGWSRASQLLDAQKQLVRPWRPLPVFPVAWIPPEIPLAASTRPRHDPIEPSRGQKRGILQLKTEPSRVRP